ncbi:MAG: hypothetical protein ABL921_15270, partial [Pirellula sp.]
TPPKDPSTIDKLKSELRSAVDKAFKARHDLHLAEVTSLTMKAQAMMRGLEERTKSHAEIVDRRIDDLLNPSYRWDTSPKPISQSGPSNTAVANASVSGVVTFRGKPILGTIYFDSGRELPSSTNIDNTGKFHIEGLIAGKHKITITPESAILKKELFGKIEATDQTPIEMEFEPGKNDFNIELNRTLR